MLGMSVRLGTRPGVLGTRQRIEPLSLGTRPGSYRMRTLASKKFQQLKDSLWPPKVFLRKCFPYLCRYLTRVFVAVVWCAVLWALLGTDAFPREYIEDQDSDKAVPNPPCYQLKDLSSEEFNEALRRGSPINTSELNRSSEQAVVTVLHENETVSYQVITAQLDSECQNLLQVLRVELVETNGSFSENLTTVVNVTSTLDLSQSSSEDLSEEEDTTTLLYLPDGHFFALGLLLVFSLVCGFLAKLVFLPPLFGMILAGFILRNVSAVDFANDISPPWSSTLRNVALAIVLIRGGLALNPKQLKRLKRAVVLLAFVPCILEGALDGLIATFYLGMPWQWGFLLGYIIAAISPAIVVPTTLSLQEQGYGTSSGIPTLVVAAASMDVVTSISLFGVFLGLAFSEGQLLLDIFRGPIQIVVGLLYGIVFGLLLWKLPTDYSKSGSKLRNRFFLLFGLSLVGIFGSRRAMLGGSSLAGAGALAVLVLAFVAGQGWTKTDKAMVSRVFLILWQLAQPLLFALIGAEVDLSFITPSLIGQGIVLIVSGLVLRLTASFLVVFGNGFSVREMIFVAIAWLPKATVQAAIGSIALDTAVERDTDPEEEDLGREVLTLAVLSIVLTAPLGAIAISLLGPVLLKKSEEPAHENSDSVVDDLDGHRDQLRSNGKVCPPLEIDELRSSPTMMTRATLVTISPNRDLGAIEQAGTNEHTV